MIEWGKTMMEGLATILAVAILLTFGLLIASGGLWLVTFVWGWLFA